MTKKETLAYLAGIVDGEGYIGIKRDHIKGRGINPVYYERMSVAGTSKPMIDLFISFFKCGQAYFHRHSKLSRRGYWSWETSNLKAVSVIKQLYPYIRIKKPEVKLILQLYENKRKKYGTLPKEIIEIRENLYQGIKSLHTFV